MNEARWLIAPAREVLPSRGDCREQSRAASPSQPRYTHILLYAHSPGRGTAARLGGQRPRAVLDDDDVGCAERDT